MDLDIADILRHSTRGSPVHAVHQQSNTQHSSCYTQERPTENISLYHGDVHGQEPLAVPPVYL